jgi:hypothetical protein
VVGEFSCDSLDVEGGLPAIRAVEAFEEEYLTTIRWGS